MLEKLEGLVAKQVEADTDELNHKIAKWALAGFAALIVDHFIRLGYDAALAAYRARRT
jgi:hypothetical protein